MCDIVNVSAVMVDGEKAAASTMVRAESEVALLPPVSGGSDTPRVAVLTVSDRVSAGIAQDLTGPAIAGVLPYAVAEPAVVADDRPAIEEKLRTFCDEGFDVIITNGGTGLGPRDVTPEATLAVVERQVPGLAEVMRSDGRGRTPLASLSRQVAGVRGHTLIINVPGSPKGAVECVESIAALLPHAVAMLAGGSHDAE
jgi:molybdopterin adenylyltransferase